MYYPERIEIMRTSEIKRSTSETEVSVKLCVDGTGRSVINTGVGFLDHMLTLFALHGRFDLEVTCTGDTVTDDHHSVEDIGITLGRAFDQACGDRRGITRYGSTWLPMDEALVLCAADVSGRSCLRFGVRMPAEKVGSFDTELVEEFFTAFTREFPLSLHFILQYGTNTHHIIEAVFKSFARTLSACLAADSRCPDTIPSSKGVL